VNDANVAHASAMFVDVKGKVKLTSAKVCWYLMEFLICALVLQLNGHTRTDMLID